MGESDSDQSHPTSSSEWERETRIKADSDGKETQIEADSDVREREARIEADSDRDRWFTAEQAKDYGFIDHVVTSAREAADEGRPSAPQRDSMPYYSSRPRRAASKPDVARMDEPVVCLNAGRNSAGYMEHSASVP